MPAFKLYIDDSFIGALYHFAAAKDLGIALLRQGATYAVIFGLDGRVLWSHDSVMDGRL